MNSAIVILWCACAVIIISATESASFDCNTYEEVINAYYETREEIKQLSKAFVGYLFLRTPKLILTQSEERTLKQFVKISEIIYKEFFACATNFYKSKYKKPDSLFIKNTESFFNKKNNSIFEHSLRKNIEEIYAEKVLEKSIRAFAYFHNPDIEFLDSEFSSYEIANNSPFSYNKPSDKFVPNSNSNERYTSKIFESGCSNSTECNMANTKNTFDRTFYNRLGLLQVNLPLAAAIHSFPDNKPSDKFVPNSNGRSTCKILESGCSNSTECNVANTKNTFDQTFYNRFGLLQVNLPLAASVHSFPGIEYPDFASIPKTSFVCDDTKYIPGFYADLETGCQVFHVCWIHRRESFLCPLGTIFNQQTLSCDYWFETDCSSAPNYYKLNEKWHKQYEPEEMIQIDDSIYAENKDKYYDSKRYAYTLLLPKKSIKFIPVSYKTIYFDNRPILTETFMYPKGENLIFSAKEFEQLFHQINDILNGGLSP